MKIYIQIYVPQSKYHSHFIFGKKRGHLSVAEWSRFFQL